MTEARTLIGGDTKHSPSPASASDEDEILKYLLTDSEFSSPEGSPLLVLDNDSPISSDSSPWRNDDVFPTVPSGLQDISIDLDTNPESLLYGSSFNSDDYTSSIPIPPANLSPVAEVPSPDTPIAPSTATLSSANATAPSKKASRSKKRPRVSDPPPIPSPEKAEVALPRDTLLQISSQGMERYVENLSSARSLSMDDQKELKRQKRLIKNRESAQLSRERKRAYIDQLEERVNQLLSENTLLRNDNTTLRQALSQYQPGSVFPKVESTAAEMAYRKDPVATKMAGLLTSATSIGGNRPSTTAKAGVCLLIVLFTFGLFMNSTAPVRPGSLLAASKGRDPVSDLVSYNDRPIGYKRSILEAFPEVMDEENEEYYESNKKQLISTDATKIIVPIVEHKKQVLKQVIQHPIQVKPAGIYKVSYSPEPAQFLPAETVVGEEHSHSNKEDNSTYMLFLDPRPDLDNDNDDAEAVATVSKSDLQVSTHTHKHVLEREGLPPMIISLVVPNHIANGSNPLFPKDGYSSNSLMEVTCQVMDISITTSDRPAQGTPTN